MGTREYSVPWLAEILHSFPHVDLSFRHINSTFDPENAAYRESLVFWAALPVLWLLATLLAFLIYFCYRCCCQRDGEKAKSVPCLRWSMAILALCTCAAVGVGFYGNEDAHKGSMNFANAADDADITVQKMKSQLQHLGKNVNITIDRGLNSLKRTFQERDELNQSVQSDLHQFIEQARNHARQIRDSVAQIKHKAANVNMKDVVKYIKEYGFYRWLGMILLLSWVVALCLLLLLGIGRSSKCTLLMFCAFGIFTLVLSFMSSGLHLGVGIGLGDFCIEPGRFIERLGPESMKREIASYYIKCDAEKSVNPFKDALRSASDNIRQANSSLRKAVKLAQQVMDKSYYTTDALKVQGALNNTVGTIMQLTALVECTNLHKDYVSGIQGVCYQTLLGVVFLTLSGVLTGLLLTVLVVLASKAWKHFGRTSNGRAMAVEDQHPFLPYCDDASVSHYRDGYGPVAANPYTYTYSGELPSPSYQYQRKGYLEIDEDDPFLPRPDNASPSYYSFTRGSRGNPREQMQMQQRRSTPPPAYNSNEFYRNYTDLNHTDEPGPDFNRESNA